MLREGQFSGLETQFVSTAAELRLRHSGEFRDQEKREGLIAAVRSAVERHAIFRQLSCPLPASVPGENPLLRLAPAGPAGGFATGFLSAWSARAPELVAITKEYGLFNAGLAALALSQPTDDPDAIMLLQNIVEIWRDGRSAASRRRNATQDRSPFIALVRQTRKNHPDATARELWYLLCGEHEIDFKGVQCQIDVRESSDGTLLIWDCYGDGVEKNGYKSKKGFAQFLSRYTSNILP